MPSTIQTLEKKIADIRNELAALGPMRPGTLGRQYRDREEKSGGFWQISYTHKRRSRSDYLKPEHLEEVKTELENFATFRSLTERWVDLSLELSQLKRKSPEKKQAKRPNQRTPNKKPQTSTKSRQRKAEK
jgi:hypothetical protein